MQLNFYELYKQSCEEVVLKQEGKLKWSVFDTKRNAYLRYVTLVTNEKGYKKDTIYGWSSVEKAEEWINKSMDNYYQRQVQKAEMKAERKRLAEEFREKLKIGDILSGEWGYEACFYEFYEVIGKQGSYVLLKELNKERRFDDLKYGACSEGIVKAGEGYASDTILKRKIGDGCVKINSYLSVSPWDGREHEEANWH